MENLSVELPDIRFRPLNDFIVVQRCVNPHEEDASGKVLIWKPDKTHDRTNWCKILSQGPKCKYDWLQGAYILSPEWGTGLHCADRETEVWFLKEDWYVKNFSPIELVEE